MLIVHHLGHSQSERVVWLCEELNIPYDLKVYQRSPFLPPPEYSELHPLGAAPVIQDITDEGSSVTLAESGACVEYIIHKHGKGRLSVPLSDPLYAEYLYWFHFVNGTLQPTLGRARGLQGAGVSEDNPQRQFIETKSRKALTFLDTQVAKTGAWVVGENLTAADIMLVFTLTGMREFLPLDLHEYPNILLYLQRVVARDSYRRAMKKGDPDIDVESLIQASSPPPFQGGSK